MRMCTIAANDLREIQVKANEMGITQEQIVNIFQNSDGTYMLVYYSE